MDQYHSFTFMEMNGTLPQQVYQMEKTTTALQENRLQFNSESSFGEFLTI
jgi:hypothetical protein